jgi:hypothetical protein
MDLSWMFLLAATGFAVALPPGGDLFEINVRDLATVWEKEHVSPSDPYSLKHAELKRRLESAQSQYPDLIRLEIAGRSLEGREIYLVQLGSGPRHILSWSQMHGDEPTATSALLDLFQFFGQHRREPWVSEILQKFTLQFIPMLNPDGAERNQRRNAQGLDINRDARLLQAPEGKILKSVRDRYRPFLGFNLHNQNGLTTVGDTGKVATIALLAVVADAPGTPMSAPASGIPDNLTKQVTAVIFEALSPFIYGHISRYDEAYNPRAFGDNLTLWGTPVVLIESGGLPAGEPENLGVKLNFVGLLATFNSLATGRIQNANPAVFDSLKLNSDSPIYDLLLRNAWIFTGTGIPLFRGDVAVRFDQRAKLTGESIVADLGDLGVNSAHRTIDCTDAMVTPGLIAWDPLRPLLSDPGTEAGYLRKGVTTLLETLSMEDAMKLDPSPQIFAATRPWNWSFLISGQNSSGTSISGRVFDWLAAGARGWVVESIARLPSGTAKFPGYFGVDLQDRASAEKFALPETLQGDPVQELPRWTSEAARKFRIPRRGIIAQGAVADLVIWTVSPGGAPGNLSGCKPSQVILNGRVFDLRNPGEFPRGKFMGRP